MKKKRPRSRNSKPSGTGKVGHPPFVATPEQQALVDALTGYGIPQDEICKLVINPTTGYPIDEKTLRQHFRPEIDRGKVSANARVIGAMFKNATTPTKQHPGGDPTSQIFWAKCRIPGWNPQSNSVLIPVPTGSQPEEISMTEAARRIAFALELATRPTIEGESREVDA